LQRCAAGLHLAHDVLQVADAAGEAVDAGHQQDIAGPEKIEHGAQFLSARRGRARDVNSARSVIPEGPRNTLEARCLHLGLLAIGVRMGSIVGTEARLRPVRLHANYVSVGESGDEYFQVSFDSEAPATMTSICRRQVILIFSFSVSSRTTMAASATSRPTITM